MAVLLYVIIRAGLYLVSNYAGIDKAVATLLIIGEFFILIHAFGYCLHVLRVFRVQEEIPSSAPALSQEPPVAIVVPARHEPKEILEKTFITIGNIEYGNKDIFLLDDSSDEEYKRQADELAQKLNFRIFRRLTRHGAKAGILNDFLKNVDHTYIVMFDADQTPTPDFLKRLVPLMESDSRLAFIQTPQFYSNTSSSRIAKAAAFQQAVFYEYICESKGLVDSMFCCGTNIIFRRQALLDVEFFDETSVTEDVATSVRLHSRGWKSKYYSHTCAFGNGPEDFEAYFKQQYRWATGTISLFKKLLGNIFSRRLRLRLSVWWEYLLSSSYYLVGLAFFFLMICPIIYIFFTIPSFFNYPDVYFTAFIPYFILSTSIFYKVLGMRNYRVIDLYSGQLLSAVTFPVYMHAAIFALLGRKTEFSVTKKTQGRQIPYRRLWPQMLMAYLCFAAFIWSLTRFKYEGRLSILFVGLWAFYYFLILTSIFYFNSFEK